MTNAGDRNAQTLLVVDDDAVFRTRVMRAFHDRGYDVHGAASHGDAVAQAQADSPELAIVDLRLPDRSGLDVVRDLRAIDPATRIVVLTGYGSIATAVESIRLGAATYLTKPVDADQIEAAFDGNAAASRQPAVSVPTLARVEWEHIQRVLTDCGGNLSQAARLLGMHRRSLQRKLAKDPGPQTLG
jgi:two-component system response regulator RegA